MRSRVEGAQRRNAAAYPPRAAEGPLDVTELSERLGVSSYNASKHLRVLREARAPAGERDGRRRLYSVPKRGDQLKVVGDVLDSGCCIFRFKQL